MTIASSLQPHLDDQQPLAGAATTVGVVGGSGFTGALLAELLLRHPSVHLLQVSSEALAGEPVRKHLPRLRSDLMFCPEAAVTGLDLAFVCLPHGEAAPVVERLLDDGARVVDLSADFRLSAADYAAWYGNHPCPSLTPGAYGLTELHRDEIRAAHLIANPGCYPTAALLALTPLRQMGLVDVVIDAKSGVSGAGKSASGRTHFCTVDSDLVAYGVESHRHYPEILAGLAAAPAAARAAASPFGVDAGGGTPSLTFVPHLVPLQRGIVETIYVRPGTFPLPGTAQIRALFDELYDGEQFVEICDEPPKLKDVAGTNVCRLYATVDQRAGRVIVIAALDNLMKGAAGQAVQNMNLMLGLPENEGLL